MKILLNLIFVTLIIISASCSNTEPDVSFYFWKTKAELKSKEKQALLNYQCKDLYVRFFDVDKENDSIVPLGIISGLDSLPKNISIIPVVFITNRTFIKMQPDQIRLLAGRVHQKISDMLNASGKTTKEIQIDCDWSDETKLNYFEFLKILTSKCKNTELSCTVRLHQIKYPIRTGVPPVSKGVAMVYNIGNITEMKGKNSIYNEDNLKQYVSYLASYPLKLDVAMPIFSWQVKYRKDELIDIIQKDQGIDTADTKLISRKENTNVFRINSSFLHEGRYYREGDQIKLEFVSEADLIKMSELLAENIKQDYKPKIIFFDLDEYNLNRYKDETLKEVITNFN